MTWAPRLVSPIPPLGNTESEFLEGSAPKKAEGRPLPPGPELTWTRSGSIYDDSVESSTSAVSDRGKENLYE